LKWVQFLEKQVLYLVFSKYRGIDKNITKSRPQSVQIRWLKVVKSIWTEEISLWDTFSQSKYNKMSAKSIYRCKNSLSDTFYEVFLWSLDLKSISENNFRLPDTFRTYFKMFICKKSIWATNCMSLDTFSNFIMLNSSTNRRNSQISWAEVKCNDRRIRPVAVRLWGRSPSRRLSQSLTGTWTSRREWSVGVKDIWEFLRTFIIYTNPNLYRCFTWNIISYVDTYIAY